MLLKKIFLPALKLYLPRKNFHKYYSFQKRLSRCDCCAAYSSLHLVFSNAFPPERCMNPAELVPWCEILLFMSRNYIDWIQITFVFIIFIYDWAQYLGPALSMKQLLQQSNRRGFHRTRRSICAWGDKKFIVALLWLNDFYYLSLEGSKIIIVDDDYVSLQSTGKLSFKLSKDLTFQRHIIIKTIMSFMS